MSASPTSSACETEKSYDSWADWIPYIHGQYDEGVEFFYRSVGQTLKRYLPAGRVMDAGCGVGLSSGGALKAGFEVTGVDLSSRSIEKCQVLKEAYGDKARFVVADLLDLPEDIRDFDGIVATAAILHHFLREEDQLRFLRQLHAALKPGGILLISTSDYRKRLDEEPDDYFTRPVRCRDGEQREFLYFQQRKWSGRPRQRVYKSIYYRIRDNLTCDRVELTLNAITVDEVDGLLARCGFTPIDWLDEAETGFHKKICIARRA